MFLCGFPCEVSGSCLYYEMLVTHLYTPMASGKDAAGSQGNVNDMIRIQARILFPLLSTQTKDPCQSVFRQLEPKKRQIQTVRHVLLPHKLQESGKSIHEIHIQVLKLSSILTISWGRRFDPWHGKVCRCRPGFIWDRPVWASSQGKPSGHEAGGLPSTLDGPMDGFCSWGKSQSKNGITPSCFQWIMDIPIIFRVRFPINGWWWYPGYPHFVVSPPLCRKHRFWSAPKYGQPRNAEWRVSEAGASHAIAKPEDYHIVNVCI